MANILVDLNKAGGIIKPMNAVNNGPVGGASGGVRKNGNFEDYKALEIPYARNHDAAFCADYGGPHTVDVHNIFKNFDADENDPASYTFKPTDTYIKNTLDAGTETFYRLGAAIEHGYKYGTYPPKDFAKWARICEHIIRHYNEGWADGFNYNIEYWEIWNEPDCRNADGSTPCWQGTEEEFIDFYEVAAKHLKACFPNIKLGGPAFTSSWRTPFTRAFLKAVKEREIPFDYYSYHCYAKEPRDIFGIVLEGENALEEAGFDKNFPTILNEWNYVRGWLADEWRYSLKSEMSLKGAAFIAGTMAICQNSSLDMLMYYDFRPCAMNGVFSSYFYEHLKGYYSFVMFRDLRRLGTWIETPRLVDDFYSCAATDGKNVGVMVTHYNDNDNTAPKKLVLDFAGIKAENGVKVEYFLLDETHDLEKVREETFTAESFSAYLDMPVYSSYYVKVTAL